MQRRRGESLSQRGPALAFYLPEFRPRWQPSSNYIDESGHKFCGSGARRIAARKGAGLGQDTAKSQGKSVVSTTAPVTDRRALPLGRCVPACGRKAAGAMKVIESGAAAR
jgi:hypothetical protein